MKTGMQARALALGLLDAVLKRNRLLDEAFDAEPGLARLEARDRAFTRLLVAETLRRLGQIDHLIAACLDSPLPPKAAQAQNVLRLGVAQILFLDTPAHAAVSTSVDLVKGTVQAAYGKLINAVLRRLDREGHDLIAAQDEDRLNTPDWLWHSWVDAYGEATARKIAHAHLSQADTDLWAPHDPERWAETLGATLLPTGSLRLKGGDITQLPGFEQGAWWVQDAAAALPAQLLGAQAPGGVSGKRVLDLCAAPGGKTLQLAARGAEVTAVDLSAKRMERLRQNLTRLNLSAEVVVADAGKWSPPAPFPAVLLDAPCSATGTLRRHPDGLYLKSPADVQRLALVQDRLLDAAAQAVAPGGLLVYCVCSLQSEEGPVRIERFLSRHPEFRRKPIGPDEVGGVAEILTQTGDLRSLPFHMAELGGMDAFFAARLERIAP
jgi:16S rRNA (cytosine967-C5)-methyltransferase